MVSYSTLGSSLAHLPLAHSSLFLSLATIVFIGCLYLPIALRVCWGGVSIFDPQIAAVSLESLTIEL